MSEIDQREVELYELKGRLVNAERRLDSLGWRFCDIPTCNCNSYHRSDEQGVNVKPIQFSLFGPKQVLDVCCGSKMFWFDRGDSRALFLDKRSESHELNDSGSNSRVRQLTISPDMVADFRNLPFKDESFPVVIFDPPHLNKLGDSGWLAKKYGKLSDDWKEMIASGFSECFRVLKKEGVLVFKWNETDIPVSEVLALTDQKPLIGNRCGKHSKSHWILFAKIDPHGHPPTPLTQME